MAPAIRPQMNQKMKISTFTMNSHCFLNYKKYSELFPSILLFE
jgi:hypothetical protein